jgi:hypothetical protein
MIANRSAAVMQPPRHERATYDFVAPDAYVHRLEASQDGRSWQVCSGGEYRREG